MLDGNEPLSAAQLVTHRVGSGDRGTARASSDVVGTQQDRFTDGRRTLRGRGLLPGRKTREGNALIITWTDDPENASNRKVAYELRQVVIDRETRFVPKGSLSLSPKRRWVSCK
jgi:hypothetical protein